MRDWEALRARAERGESLESLARRHDIPYSTLCNRAVKEGWALGRGAALSPQGEQDAFQRVAGKLLRLIEDGLDGERSFDLKELKTVTGALKELQSLDESRGGGGDSGALTVRFLGETEEMSL